MEDRLYKIFRPDEWAGFEQTRVFRGSPDDLRDGFIHLSTGDQVPGTLAHHFHDENRVVVAQIRPDARLAEKLRYEPSRSGQRFPHLYAALPWDAVTSHEIRTQPFGER